MKRPTCKTCPYWEPMAWDGISVIIRMDSRDDEPGVCLRRISNEHIRVGSGIFCGEHPDFKAYLAEWNKKKRRKTNENT